MGGISASARQWNGDGEIRADQMSGNERKAASSIPCGVRGTFQGTTWGTLFPFRSLFRSLAFSCTSVGRNVFLVPFLNGKLKRAFSCVAYIYDIYEVMSADRVMSRTGFNFCPPAVHDIHNRTHLMGERLAASHALRAAAKAKALEEEARARAERIAAARRQEELGSDADDSEASDVDEADADEADDALASANGAAPLGSDLGDDDAGLATMAFGERLAAADEGAGGSAEEDDALLGLDDDDGEFGLMLDDVGDSMLARGVERVLAD